MMSEHVLYICGPYPGNRNFKDDDVLSTARQITRIADEMGWVPICPSISSAEEPWRFGRTIIYRLRPEVDAVLCLRGWNMDTACVHERQSAVIRGVPVYESTPKCVVPTIEVRGMCPHYREVHYETSDRDTCDARIEHCPDGVTCPIRRKTSRNTIKV